MASVIRVCNPFNAKQVLHWDYSKNKFTGSLAHFVNDLHTSIERSANITFLMRSEDDGVGELISPDGTFDGCVGSIQRNESDFMPREFAFPSDAVNVTQGLIMGDSTMQFMTLYRTIDEVKNNQVISSFNCFEMSVWLLCLLTLVVGYLCFIAVGYVHERQSVADGDTDEVRMGKDKLYQLATHMTARGSFRDHSSLSRKVLFLSLSLFPLLVLFYFSSMIKTEVVVVDEPFTHKTYQDLLESGVKISILRVTDAYLNFKYAEAGSAERQLWDMSLTKNGSEDEIHIEPNERSISQVVRRMQTHERTWVLESLWMHMMQKEFCGSYVTQRAVDLFSPFVGVKRFPAKSVLPYVGQDPNARSLLKGFIMNRSSTPVMKRLRRVMSKLLEAHLHLRTFNAVEDLDLAHHALQSLTGPVKKNTGDEIYQKCINNIIVKPEIDPKPIKLTNVSELMRLIMHMYAIAIIVLLVELTIGTRGRRRR